MRYEIGIDEKSEIRYFDVVRKQNKKREEGSLIEMMQSVKAEGIR